MIPVAFGVSAQPMKHVPASPTRFGMAWSESARLTQHWTDLIKLARLQSGHGADLSKALRESLENDKEPEVLLEASTNFLLFLAQHASDIERLDDNSLRSNIMKWV